MPNESEMENDLIDGMTVDQIRDRLQTPNRCWSDSYCDCAQQHAADRLLEHYDALAARLAEMRQAMDELHVKHGRSMRGIEQLEARLAEAVECCTIKDNRNLWLEIRLKKIMARCADLLDEDQFNELDAIARPADSASAVQPERCCLDYPVCDCNSPPELEDAPAGWKCSCGTSNSDDYDRCLDCKGLRTWTQQADNAPTLQPCGHPWKARHDFKCILCSSPG